MMWRSIAALLALSMAVGCGSNVPTASSEPVSPAVLQEPVASGTVQLPLYLENRYQENELFLSAIAAPPEYSGQGRLVAGMVPHHLLASDMIAGFFSLASRQQPGYDAVLIVSPSHFPENCDSLAVTAMAGWNTTLGRLEVDSEMVEALLENKTLAAANQPEAVALDHGAAGLTTFVKRYLPDLPVAVCLLSNRLPPQRLAAFQQTVARQLEDRSILVVASADCSHYLMPEEAAKHDSDTIAAIEGQDIATLLSYSDQNIDSPQAVTSFIAAAGESAPVLLDHSSSDKKLPHALTNSVYMDGTTTYMVYGCFAGK